MLFSTKKFKTFNKASSSVKSGIILLRGRLDKLGLKKFETEFGVVNIALSNRN
jgi:hypothetical protein